MGACFTIRRSTYRSRNNSNIYIPNIQNISNISNMNIEEKTDTSLSDISCNFIYENNEELVIIIAAALGILLSSIQDEYEICILCLNRIATMKTTSCNHNILCSNCYINYCINNTQKQCPICRRDIYINDPFIIS